MNPLVFLLIPIVVFAVMLWAATRRGAQVETGPPRTAHNQTRDVSLGDRIVWADTADARRQGLLGRDSLEPGEGIYLLATGWVHMFGMRFAIDTLHLSQDGRVLAARADLKPWRVGKPHWKADGVLELPAGTLSRTGTRVGDVIRFGDA